MKRICTGLLKVAQRRFYQNLIGRPMQVLQEKGQSRGQADYDIHQLDQAANRELFKKYKVGDSPYAPQIETTKGGEEYVKNDNGTYSKKYPYAGQTGRFPQLGYQKDFNDTYYSPIGDNVNDEPYERTSYNDFKLHKDRHNDMSNYFKGNSKYVKGQGWQ